MPGLSYETMLQDLGLEHCDPTNLTPKFVGGIYSKLERVYYKFLAGRAGLRDQFAELFPAVNWDQLCELVDQEKGRSNRISMAGLFRLWKSCFVLCQEKAKAKKTAKDLGLKYWPAIQYDWQGQCDPAAYKAAEEILALDHGYYNPSKDNHGGWDSWGHKGLPPWFIRQAWYRAGCQANLKFAWQVQTGYLAPKKMSVRRSSYYCKAKRWLDRNNIVHNLPRSVLVTLGRLSAALRWAAIFDRDPLTVKRISDLNWPAVARLQRKKGVARYACAPRRLQWQALTGQDLPPADLDRESPLSGVSLKLYQQLCDVCRINPWGKDDTNGLHLPLFRLAQIFKSTQEVSQYLGKFFSVKKLNSRAITALHDAGQFSRPTGNKKRWKQLVLKYGPEITSLSGSWQAIESLALKDQGKLPTTLAEVKTLAGKLSYDLTCLQGAEASKADAIIDACLQAKFGQRQFEKFAKYFLALPVKTSETIPHVKVQSKHYTLTTLDFDDPQAPLLGIYTNCCQHPEGAAKSCAETLITSGKTCAVAIKDSQNKILAQSYVWRSSDRQEVVIIDSIEGLDWRDSYFDLYIRFSLSLLGKLGIKEIRVGATNYGKTPDFRNQLQKSSVCRDTGNLITPTDTTFCSDCPSNYSDATSGQIVVAKK